MTAIATYPSGLANALRRRAAVFATLLVIAVPGAGFAQVETEAEALVTEARLTVDRLMADEDFFELPKFIKSARGIYIVPQLVKGGFIIGAEGGSGVFLARGTDGSWSSPAFYTLGAGSIGLQIGGEVKETVFVLMSDKAVDAMLSSEFKLGADASVTVGPLGRGIEASRSTDFSADIYAFSKSVGLFGGGALEGAKIFARTSLNEAYYAAGATPQAIVIERKYTNIHAEPLRQLLP